MVGRPREDKTQKTGAIALKIAEGAYQPTVARELGAHLSTVQRTAREVRAELVGAEGPGWRDAVQTSAVQVARVWLERNSLPKVGA